MIFVIHSSKTMRPAQESTSETTVPLCIDDAKKLAGKLAELSSGDIETMMQISPKLAESTKRLLGNWTAKSTMQRPAVDSFLGDIYSGLQVSTWSKTDRKFAETHLRILSGLYGILRPSEGIFPYRLEMGYKLPNIESKNLYDFWGTKIAETIPEQEIIVDLSAVEYDKVLTKYIDSSRFITPKFLTRNPRSGEPKNVTVHTKIARGAFANWCIKNQVSKSEQLKNFAELGYRYDGASAENQPTFICDEFGGLGLSVRQT